MNSLKCYPLLPVATRFLTARGSTKKMTFTGFLRVSCVMLPLLPLIFNINLYRVDMEGHSWARVCGRVHARRRVRKKGYQG